ncbi:hypothetical protein AB0F17_10330 [Nonomuraea sp. NPDC026600]|uniref:hypothetical protein n=1 Tax=Nonomuraea sp. NPDC026600 TaxID=3155363 RepID=UPI0033E6C4B4
MCNVSPDEARESALRAAGGRHSEAVRFYGEMLLEQAATDAERLRDDPDDQAEMLAIQRFMGVTE